MDEPRWLDEREQRAWRSFVTMEEGLSEYIERQLRAHSGISSADYEVLAHLSEAPEGRMRSNALGRLLRWEKGRLRCARRGDQDREARMPGDGCDR